MFLTQSLVELDYGDAHGVVLVGDGVVAELGHPAAGRPVLRARVHQPVADVHAHDGAAVSVYGLLWTKRKKEWDFLWILDLKHD